MSTSRRNFIKVSAGLALASKMVGGANASEPPAGIDFQTITNEFDALGYQAVRREDLITGHLFNGGVRYDENREFSETSGGEPQKWFVIQDCARVEDVARRGEFGVLAYFHIGAFVENAPAARGDVLKRALDFLIGSAGLDPERIVLVATELGKPFLEHSQSYGIHEEQIVIRSLEEARKSGDGSGYFNPKGHPHVPKQHTISVHYVPPGVSVSANPSYPLPDLIEIGEFGFNESEEPGELFGFGVERLQMAAGYSAGDFISSRDELLLKLREEADQRKLPLPSAYKEFSSL